jgi:hypothetical protein
VDSLSFSCHIVQRKRTTSTVESGFTGQLEHEEGKKSFLQLQIRSPFQIITANHMTTICSR